MVTRFLRHSFFGGVASLALLPISAALAQQAGNSSSAANAPADIVVTADRVEEPAEKTGSSISVIDSTEIERTGATNLADVFRSVPGVDVEDSGGIGTATQVSIRGSTAGQTLVLIDGIRIGDPTATDGSLDFGNLATTNIDRIEVLRGPQSALYGSDAMGGVINIITKKGSQTPQRSVSVEAGSYGTIDTRASMSGGDDRWTYALSIDALHSDGFPRYGYRINRPIVIGDGVTPLPPLPADDPTDKGGASGRFTYRLSDDVTVETGFNVYGNALRFDNSFAFMPSDVFSSYNHSRAAIYDGHTSILADALGGLLHNRLTVYGNVTDRNVWEAEGCFDASFNAINCRSGFVGSRYGAEYQGDLKLGSFGLLTFGARSETETAHTSEDPNPNDGSFFPVSAHQTTDSVFAQHQVTFGDRFDVSYGGRIDSVENGPTFATGRVTAAYHIDETGTKLHASVGTGARVASLYQRFSQFGDANLQPERNIGYDAGIDQKLFGDRVTASVTAFDNHYRNLIDFASVPSCTPAQVAAGGGCYFNVGRAETKGIETAADVVIVPDQWRTRVSYTYMVATDLKTNTELLERPRNNAAVSLIYMGVPKLEVEGRLTLVGSRLAFGTFSDVELEPYAKVDVYANYKATDQVTVFGRIENLTDTHYEEAYNFGTAGRSFYGGVKVAW